MSPEPGNGVTRAEFLNSWMYLCSLKYEKRMEEKKKKKELTTCTQVMMTDMKGIIEADEKPTIMVRHLIELVNKTKMTMENIQKSMTANEAE